MVADESAEPSRDGSGGGPADGRGASEVGTGDVTGETPSRANGGLSPAVKSSLLWGLVGGLSFLVLVQGYELVADPGVGMGAKLGVGLAVGAGAAALTHLFRRRLRTGSNSA